MAHGRRLVFFDLDLTGCIVVLVSVLVFVIRVGEIAVVLVLLVFEFLLY